MTFRDAILRHRGEASNVTEHFENLSEPDQALLSNFLNLSNGKRDSEASSSTYDLIEVSHSVESGMPCRNPMGRQIATDNDLFTPRTAQAANKVLATYA